MADTVDFQQGKLAMMKDPGEQVLALDLWRLQALLDEATRKLNEFYTPLLHRCSSQREALDLMVRIPDTIEKMFYMDYIRYQRDWSVSHEDSSLGRSKETVAGEAASNATAARA